MKLLIEGEGKKEVEVTVGLQRVMKDLVYLTIDGVPIVGIVCSNDVVHLTRPYVRTPKAAYLRLDENDQVVLF